MKNTIINISIGVIIGVCNVHINQYITNDTYIYQKAYKQAQIDALNGKWQYRQEIHTTYRNYQQGDLNLRTVIKRDTVYVEINKD